MFTYRQKKEALELFDSLGSVNRVAAILGHPSPSGLRKWIAQRNLPKAPRKSPVFLSHDEKLRAVERLDCGESALDISAEIGVTAPTIHGWRRALRGEAEPVEEKEGAPEPRAYEGLPDDVDELKRMCASLRMENELMRRTVEIVKKDPGVDLRTLSNREKTALTDAMRPMYSLSSLATRLDIPLSGCRYSHNAMEERRDKYARARSAVAEGFDAVKGARGHRCIHRRLAERGVHVGERKVRQLMAEEGCVVVYARRPKRGYSSYAGEISAAPENHPPREDGTHGFSAPAPNRLWLTDITESKLPDDGRKVYLSPILDCFDGRMVSWSIGARPTAEPANSSLSAACAALGKGERPVCHSDRGAHCRWSRWIDICAENGLVRSMSRKAKSPDNARMEGFFGILKQEFFYCRDWSNVAADQFMRLLDEWLGYCNDERIKRTLGWMSPNQYRKSLGLAA
ncbi:MAG: IS3 family transposase [Slackia sp.]|uniref:IS3 family transposase n=1 Tax=uncultured Slackia sp. TaxID=665903 RepID=UPI002805BC92|nr:IS3 family transposase [uncultured Slackia sp.]MDU6012139.1 IS3 family transposase [Slackia sp.]